MPNNPINNASVSMIKQIQLSNVESYAALRTSALATGTVNLGSTSTVITATTNLPEGLTLTDGVLVLITNNVVSSASGWTLNVDNTGSKPVYSSLESSTRTSTIFKLNTSLLFRYNATRVNGGCWDVYGYDESFQKGKTYYIDPTDSNGEIQTSADIYDILQQDEYANFILNLEFLGYYDGRQAILIQRPMTRTDNAIFLYIDNNIAGDKIVFHNFDLDCYGNHYDTSQTMDIFPALIPIFPLSTTNKTCAATSSMPLIFDALLKRGHVIFMNPSTQEIIAYLVINNYVQDDETPEYKLGLYGITKENELIQITLEPNPDSSSNYKMIGTYTVTDLVGPEYFVVNITNNTGSLVSDKTITEINAANTRGAHICAKTPNGVTGNLSFFGEVNDSYRTAIFTVFDGTTQYDYHIDSSSVWSNSTTLATSNDISSVCMTIDESFFKPLLLLEQSGSTVTLVFGENSSATNPFINPYCSSLNNFANMYARGLHCEFYLPDTQTSSSTDFLVFHLIKMDLNTYQCEFACERGDTIYTISMTPTSTTTLSGTLSSHSIPDVSGLYTKPAGGIPATDLAQSVQTSLSSADTAYQKPAGGIPATDLANNYAGSASASGPANLSVAIPFGQVDSTSTSTAFTVQIPSITSLYDGVCMYVKNGVVTSASGFTIQLNNFDPLPVYQTLAAATRGTTIFNINYTMLFVYNSSRVSGGCWDIFYGYNSNDNTIAYNIRQYQAARTMKSALYRYMFVFTALDGTLVPSCGTSNSTATTKTLSTVAFDPFGPVYYYATTTTVSAGSAPGAGNFWRAYSACNMRYAWNVSSTALTVNSPVFVRLAPQSDNTVKLDGNNCIVQTLPNSTDGKVYMYLGQAYSQYQIELNFDHPLYCYRNGHIQQWTGIESELDEKAPLASPAFTGTPTAPTPTAGNSSTIVANTGWVQGEIADALSDISGAMHFKGRALQTLTDGGTENAASSSGSPYTGEAGDVYLQSGTDTNEEYVWVKLGDAAGYWEKLGRDDLPTASTTTAGIVQLGAGSSQAAKGNHTHGNISNTGTMSATASVSPGDKIVIGQNTTGTLILGPEFSTVTTNFLNSAGNWTVPVGDHKVTQEAAITTNSNYPILLGNTTATTAVTATVNKASTLVYNPSTKKLLVNSATVATITDIPTWTVS